MTRRLRRLEPLDPEAVHLAIILCVTLGVRRGVQQFITFLIVLSYLTERPPQPVGETAARRILREFDVLAVIRTGRSVEFFGNAVGFHPGDHRNMMERLFAGIEDPESEFHVDCQFVPSDGEWRQMELRYRNILTDDIINGMLLYLRD